MESTKSLMFHYLLYASHILPGGRIPPNEQECPVQFHYNLHPEAVHYQYDLDFRTNIDSKIGVKVESNNNEMSEVEMSIFYSPQFIKHYINQCYSHVRHYGMVMPFNLTKRTNHFPWK